MTPRDLLRLVAQFTDVEWGAVERGEAVAKILETDTREVAVAGAVRIQGTRDQLVSRFRDLDAYLDAALTVTVALDFPQGTPANAAAHGFYAISVSRARTRSLSGLMRRIARSTVQSRSRETMRKILGSTKVAIESQRPLG
jgi:hypothetical protein